jgi:hypothetical protein
MLALGDIIERCLRFFGITKERVQAVARKEDCGCAKRQAAMNQWGYRLQSRLLLPYYWLREKTHHLVQGRTPMRCRIVWYHIYMAFRVLFYGR